MGDFNRGNRFGGKRSFGQRDFGGRGGDRQMFRATCSKCGKDCEVPFKPSGSKPVFCSDCFEKNNRGSDSRSFGDRVPRRSNFEVSGSEQPQNRDQLNAINAKLDKILSILSPTPVKIEEKPAIGLDEIINKPEEKMTENQTIQLVESVPAPKKKEKASK